VRRLLQARHDPALIAEAAKINLELNFVSGEDIQALVERLYHSPSDVVARAQASRRRISACANSDG
jgi:hypothetical protein